MFERLIGLVGEEKLTELQNTKVLIIGIGGVGGYALEAIARNGIGDIHIIDRDIIELSNLNRQLISNQNNLGEAKVEVAKKRTLTINPEVKITALKINLDDTNIDEILSNKYDYIIDACDDIDAKLLLMINEKRYNYKLISSMGTANKFNPSLFSITDLTKTHSDPIARILRSKIKELRINHKIKVVSSTEAPKPNGKTLGTNSFIPATAGILCASYVINDIINKEKYSE